MSFTLEQLTAVKQAIASGTLEVEFNGKRVKYRSMSELREAKELIEAELIALGIYTPPTAGTVRTSIFRRER